MATICVYCASSERISEHYVALAAEVGTELARRGHDLVTGGGSVSMMGAVARAARAGGARTIGVIPRAIQELEIADQHSDELVVVDTMRQRKAIMDDRSDAFISLPGGIGTLEELLEVWTARTLGMHTKPVVVVDPDDAYAPFRAMVERFVERGFARPTVQEHLLWATSAVEALDLCERGAPAPPPAAEELLEDS